MLFGTGLAGLAGWRWRKTRAATINAFTTGGLRISSSLSPTPNLESAWRLGHGGW